MGPKILWPSSALVLAAWIASFRALERGGGPGGKCCVGGIFLRGGAEGSKG